MPESKQNETDEMVPASAAQALAGARRTPSAEDEAYDIRIARDGIWYYHGSPIGRPAMVKLFATVLRRDAAGDFWLVTPAERGRISVEDTPFLAVALEVTDGDAGPVLRLRTNLDEWVEAGPDHPIRVVTDPATGEPNPYIVVRGPAEAPLEARINRAVFYELVERAEIRGGGNSDESGSNSDGGDEIGIWSKGVFFPLGAMPRT